MGSRNPCGIALLQDGCLRLERYPHRVRKPCPYIAAVSTLLHERLAAAIALKQACLADDALLARVQLAAERCVASLRSGGQVYWCGNGGSAADAQHLAAELTGRFYYDRPPLSSEALHANTSYLTAVANDYGYEQVFSRLLQGVGKRGDVLIGLSTSGNSANIANAFATAREVGIVTVGFTGRGGGALATLADILIDVPSTDTPRIQEVHMLFGHTVCEIVEATIFPKS